MNHLKIGNLDIAVPIIQGGMGIGVSLSGLASAVANEGGVGVISCAGLGLIHKKLSKNFLEASILGLREEIRRTRAKTAGIFGVNIMCALTNYEDMVRTAIDEKVPILFSGAGLPLDLPKYLSEESTTKLVPIVSSGRAAKLLCDKWKTSYNYLPDAVVVEGPKAGGHLGFKLAQLEAQEFALEVILADVIREVRMFEEKYKQEIPVIAAGGIYSGADICDIMALGAKGVQLGSRFVTTIECDASDAFKQMYLDASAGDVEIIQSPVGMPGRALRNSFLDGVKAGLKKPIRCPFKCLHTCDVKEAPYCIANALYNAYQGKLKSGYAFAGTNAYLSSKIISVKQTFEDIAAEIKARCAALAATTVKL